MKLIDWLQKSGKSAAQCAEFLGISAPAFSGYVTGKTEPRLRFAVKIVEELTNHEVGYRDLIIGQVENSEVDSL
jgi:predicted transcriptional regulator